MGEVAKLLETPQQFFLIVGTACLIIALLAPDSIEFVGKVEWSPRKRNLLGAFGVLLLVGGGYSFWGPLVFPPITVTTVNGPTDNAGPACAKLATPSTMQPAATIDFVNSTSSSVNIYWIDFQCALALYYTLESGSRVEQPTYEGHRWLVGRADGQPLALYAASPGRQTATIK
jgi:hypothetical protein